MIKFFLAFLSALFSRVKIFQVYGIPIYLSWIFIYFFLLLSSTAIVSGNSIIIFYILIPYVSLIFHELGHAISAKHFKYSAHDITIYPFMGLANADVPWDNPKVEFWVALCGPLVSVVLALISMPFAFYTANELVIQFFAINTMLFAFNMLPMFPMDGGRILRSALGLFFNSFKAATIAIIVSSCVLPIVLFVFIYYFSSYHLILIAPIVFGLGLAEYLAIYDFNEKTKTRNQKILELISKSDLTPDKQTEKFFYDIFEYNDLAAEAIFNLFYPLGMKKEEIAKLSKEVEIMKIFIDESKQYNINHPNWKDFEEYWISPPSYRKYIVSKIVRDKLDKEYQLFLKRFKENE
jgi:Zn-dependent protease